MLSSNWCQRLRKRIAVMRVLFDGFIAVAFPKRMGKQIVVRIRIVWGNNIEFICYYGAGKHCLNASFCNIPSWLHNRMAWYGKFISF